MDLSNGRTSCKIPIGSVYSGDLWHQLHTDGSVPFYQYTHGRLANKGILTSKAKSFKNGDVTISDFNGENMRKFNFNGMLHVMNSEDWKCVVFTNYWFALAYERSLKQSNK